jgi:lipopolysaccharide transport system permease protein
MLNEIKELGRYRELLVTLTYRDIKVRYKQSVMGFMWAILMPTLIVMSGVVVRYAYALAAHAPLRTADILDVAVKSLPWAFFVSSIRFSSLCLINNKELVTKIYFPKEIFPISAVMASFFDCTIASCALVIFLIFARVGIGINLLWVPLLVIIMIVLATGIGMIVSAASLFFRDVKFLVEVFLTFGIFFTPVFYSVSMLGDKGKWLMLNPVSPILEGFAACVVHNRPPDFLWLGYATSFAVASSLGGYMFFKHLEPAFAESI